MTDYAIDFEYNERVYGDVIYESYDEAVDMEELELDALAYIKEVYPEATNIEITKIRKITE